MWIIFRYPSNQNQINLFKILAITFTNSFSKKEKGKNIKLIDQPELSIFACQKAYKIYILQIYNTYKNYIYLSSIIFKNS